jgi:hypothetical protein
MRNYLPVLSIKRAMGGVLFNMGGGGGGELRPIKTKQPMVNKESERENLKNIWKMLFVTIFPFTWFHRIKGGMSIIAKF